MGFQKLPVKIEKKSTEAHTKARFGNFSEEGETFQTEGRFLTLLMDEFLGRQLEHGESGAPKPQEGFW